MYLLYKHHLHAHTFVQDFKFEAATDSAVPCAILIHTALAVNSLLPEHSDLGAKIVLFDGEEAFQEWRGKDNTYGSRHLAAEWDTEGFLPKIQLLVLLDLLGAANLKLYSTNQETDYAFDRLVNIEDRLLKNNMYALKHSQNVNEMLIVVFLSSINSNVRLFDSKRLRYYVEDDRMLLKFFS